MRRRFCQIPIAASTALDAILPGHRSSLQKFRQHFRQHLDIDSRDGQVSMGRHGKIVLEPAAVLPCVQTELRWSRQKADVLCEAYFDAGLKALLASPQYKQTIDITARAIQDAVRKVHSAVDVATLVNATVSNLIACHSTVRKVADEMERISGAVDRKLTELRRYPGSVVRIENGEALVLVERDGREELRLVDARLLNAVGISGPGDAFILNELQWSPETITSAYIPAVVVEDGKDAIGEELAAALTAVMKPIEFPVSTAAVTPGGRTAQTPAAPRREPMKSRG